jgi:AraC family transcriptional regulator of adaptative response / DNA-3-methyladenine glycosylase II
MTLDHDTCYSAVRSRDHRFDGRFFTGVTSTGVYCRPICPSRTPRERNCRFFACAAAAEEAGFRPCRRCRPETAPGSPAWRGTSVTVQRAMRLIGEGALDGGSVPQLAARLGVGERHLRRLFAEHLGATPAAIARTRRVHFARQLLDETNLPSGAVALAAGFGSVRRFNAAVKATFGRTPGELRTKARGHSRRGEDGNHRRPAATNGWISLTLPYRAPFDWSLIAGYLAARAMPGVETVGVATESPCEATGADGPRAATDAADGAGVPVYRRLVAAGDARGLVTVRPRPDREAVELTVESSLTGALLDLTRRTRRLCDLDADPEAIAARLAEDPLLAPLVARRPGLRIPGAWDPWELAVRAVLGQQVSVAGAQTLAGRLVTRYGEPVERADGTWYVFPSPERLSDADPARLRIPAARVAAIRALASAVSADPELLAPGASPERTMERLIALPGFGPWTAGYIALRALADPDALPAADLGLRRALEPAFGGRRPTVREVTARAEAWRPWRGYALVHLWQAGSPAPPAGRPAPRTVPQRTPPSARRS